MVATADEQVAEMIRKKGWKVLTKGWPDLLVYNPVIHDGYGCAVRGGQVLAIEIKRGNDKLRAEQEEMKNVFTYNLDVPFYVAKDEDIQAMTRKRGRIVVPWASLKDVMARVERLSNAHADLTRRIQEVNKELDSITQIFEEIPEPEKKAKVTRTQRDVKVGNRYHELHQFGRSIRDIYEDKFANEFSLNIAPDILKYIQTDAALKFDEAVAPRIKELISN